MMNPEFRAVAQEFRDVIIGYGGDTFEVLIIELTDARHMIGEP